MPKLRFVGRGCVPSEKTAQNIAYAKATGLSFVSEKERPPLAVCGGGHSIKQTLDEVRNWKGDVWLIGSSFSWWHEQGINGTFFSIHPSKMATHNVACVTDAIVATCTDPEVLDALIGKGAQVRLFDLNGNNGPTTATAAPHLALRMGYKEITFFGCDSSYDEVSTHAYMNATDEHLIRVGCCGKSFLTGAEFLMQAEYLSEMIRLAPNVFKEKSGGLLRAMVNRYDITHISKKIAADIGYKEAA